MKNSQSSVASSFMALIAAGLFASMICVQVGCAVSPQDEDSEQSSESNEEVSEVSEALGPACAQLSKKIVNAGPIWSNADAQNKCPNVCTNSGPNTVWKGQWWTTVPGQQSVCECIVQVPQKISVNAGPIWNNADAQNKCPNTCASVNRAWTGQWQTTIPGKQSVCECACTP